jgi:hypothetical protein
MTTIGNVLSAAAVALAFAASSAHADTVWNFSYSGSGVSASGQFDTLGNGLTPTKLQWMTGTYSDGTTTGSITLMPAPAASGYSTSPSHLYVFDNLYGGAGQLDYGGLLFAVGGHEVNLYLDPTYGIANLTTYAAQELTPVTFSATAVPEPAPMSLLLVGVGALGFMGRRKLRG